MKKLIYPYVKAILFTLYLTGAASAQILTNGSFETGDFTGWTAVSGPGFETVFSGAYFGGASPTDGVKMVVFNAADLPGGAYFEQSFSTIIGTTYRVSFDLGSFNSLAAGNQSFIVTTFDSSSNLLTSRTFYNQNLNGFDTGLNFNFTATTTTSKIRFTDNVVSTLSEDGFLDNISIVAVPEPSAYLMVLGLLPFILFLKKRTGSSSL